MAIGDLYCLPSSSYWATKKEQTAIPVLRGIPHDVDPHFSPGDGSTLVWRSDAELGVDNIWAMPWHGCHAHDLRRVSSSENTPYLSKEPRLMAEGRSGGALRRTHDCRYLTGAGSSSISNHKRDISIYHRPSLSPIWQEDYRDKVVHWGQEPRRWRRVGLRAPSCELQSQWQEHDSPWRWREAPWSHSASWLERRDVWRTTDWP